MFEAKRFNLPSLDGISDESVKQHLALYEGYVKNFNALSNLLPELAKDPEKNMHPLAEIIRRRSFEFGGMRLHEHYFPQFEGGPTPVPTSGAFYEAIVKEYHKPEWLIEMMKAIAAMRGPGWAMLYWDPESKQFLTGFTGEQHQGHFATLPIILALDVWEHAFLLDYGATGKGTYVDAFFKNLNWSMIEKRFDALQ
ncbi:MAG: superoxide dismutase [Candidatus Kaiserbacteria bacterium]|nr:MAG: superoxide dismutase [Candidatus Kaiserbacteria bacterium]